MAGGLRDIDLQRSLAEAEGQAKRQLGDGSRVYLADTESGRYRGELIADTEHHLVQKISAKSATAHLKHLLPDSLSTGQIVAISYSNGQVQTKPLKVREKAHCPGEVRPNGAEHKHLQNAARSRLHRRLQLVRHASRSSGPFGP